MDEKDEMFCWTYNTIDKLKYTAIIEAEGVTPVIDLTTDEGIASATALMVKRVTMLKDGNGMSMSFEEDVTSFNLLQMAASMSRRGRKWYVEKESALFESRLSRVKDSLATWFVNDIIHGEMVAVPVPGDEVSMYKDEDEPKKIKVRWERFSDLIADRKHSVKDGWVYVTIPSILIDTSRSFKNLLAATLDQTGERIKGSDIEETMTEYATLLDSMVIPFTIPSGSPASYIIERSPACMRMLDKDIASGMDIGYVASLILSFFLKSTIDLPELVEYFYSRNPGNTASYPSAESFMMARRELDYLFKQMYGEAGGGTSYDSYGCNKIEGEGCCPFATFSNKDPTNETKARVIELLDGINPTMFDGLDEATIDAMHNLFTTLVRIKGGFKKACGLEFQLRFDRESTVRDIINLVKDRERKIVSHPVKAYLEDALRLEQPRPLDEG